MSKYLVLLAVLCAAYLLWRKRQTPPAAPHGAAQKPQDMVACVRCGVHLPQSEALSAGDRHYCCAAHRDQGPA